jgi:hypothetical protein
MNATTAEKSAKKITTKTVSTRVPSGSVGAAISSVLVLRVERLLPRAELTHVAERHRLDRLVEGAMSRSTGGRPRIAHLGYERPTPLGRWLARRLLWSLVSAAARSLARVVLADLRPNVPAKSGGPRPYVSRAGSRCLILARWRADTSSRPLSVSASAERLH